MGDTVWVIPEGEDGDDWDHSIVLRQDKVLDGVAKALGKTKFSELLDYSVVAAECDGEVDPNYLSPSAALDTIEAIAAAVRDGYAPRKLKRSDDVLEELDHMCERIKQAEAEGKRVRLSVIP